MCSPFDFQPLEAISPNAFDKLLMRQVFVSHVPAKFDSLDKKLEKQGINEYL